MSRRYYKRRKKKYQKEEISLEGLAVLFVIALAYKYYEFIIPALFFLGVVAIIYFGIRFILKQEREYRPPTSSDIDIYEDEDFEQKEYETKRGDIVKSYGEQQIANYLFWRGIEYIYEQDYEREDGGINSPDFYLPKYDVYIEYFGMKNHSKKYRFEMHLKFETFQREGMKVISLYPKHIKNKTFGKAIYIEIKKLTGMELPYPNN